MTIDVIIPSMLRDAIGGRSKFSIEAETVADALRVIAEDHPKLRVHVWVDMGNVRQHVLIFHNDTGIRWMDTLDVPLKPGDRIQIVQAVSGG